MTPLQIGLAIGVVIGYFLFPISLYVGARILEAVNASRIRRERHEGQDK